VPSKPPGPSSRAGGLIGAEPEKTGIRRALALRIMAAVRVGQRDPERLRDVAVHVIEGCRITRADAA
jgi:hypothetical protein